MAAVLGMGGTRKKCQTNTHTCQNAELLRAGSWLPLSPSEKRHAAQGKRENLPRTDDGWSGMAGLLPPRSSGVGGEGSKPRGISLSLSRESLLNQEPRRKRKAPFAFPGAHKPKVGLLWERRLCPELAMASRLALREPKRGGWRQLPLRPRPLSSGGSGAPLPGFDVGSPQPAKKDRSGTAPPLFSSSGGGSPGRRKRLAPKSRLPLSRQPRQPHPCRAVSSASPTLCSGTGEPGKGKPAQLPKSHPSPPLSRPLGELTLCGLWADNILTGRTRSLPGATPAFSLHAVVKIPKAPPS